MGQKADAPDAIDLGDALEQAFARGHAAWADVALEPSRFHTYCRARLPEGAGPAAVEALQIEDLFLACACAAGDGAALRAFRDRYLARLRRVAERAGSPAHADDVAQRVMVRLLVAQDGEPPAIVKYAGRGSLDGWLDVTATREARSVMRRADPARAAADDEVERLAVRALESSVDAELESLKQAYRCEFKAAFEAAFAALERRERNTLRLEHLDGLDGAQIAALHGVNKSTISRWRAQARETLERETKRALARSLRLAPAELESVLGLIASQLDASFSRILREDREPEGQ